MLIELHTEYNVTDVSKARAWEGAIEDLTRQVKKQCSSSTPVLLQGDCLVIESVGKDGKQQVWQISCTSRWLCPAGKK